MTWWRSGAATSELGLPRKLKSEIMIHVGRPFLVSSGIGDVAKSRTVWFAPVPNRVFALVFSNLTEFSELLQCRYLEILRGYN